MNQQNCSSLRLYRFCQVLKVWWTLKVVGLLCGVGPGQFQLDDLRHLEQLGTRFLAHLPLWAASAGRGVHSQTRSGR